MPRFCPSTTENLDPSPSGALSPQAFEDLVQVGRWRNRGLVPHESYMTNAHGLSKSTRQRLYAESSILLSEEGFYALHIRRRVILVLVVPAGVINDPPITGDSEANAMA